MYVPSIGYCMLLIALLDWLIGHEERQPAEKAGGPQKASSKSCTVAVIAAAVLLIGLFSWRFVTEAGLAEINR